MIGVTLGQRYQLLRQLGRGGMGAVYEAEQVETRERVAVKVLHRHLIVSGDGPRDALFQRRFRREAEAVRAIRSDHIVRALDAGTDEPTGHLYLVTELLEGEDLQRLLDREGVLSARGALAIGAQALLGLRDAHAAGVVHRDIKPANLFLARNADGSRTVKLLDFGIAKLVADPLGSTETGDLTTTGGFLGSPLYMSPEQVQNSREVDHRSDLWSVGCVLYTALSGRAPHQHASSIGQLLVAICTTPSPPLSDVAPWLSREVTALVHGALDRRPEGRPATATAMLDALRRLGPLEPLLDDMLVSSRSPERQAIASVPPGPGALSSRVVVGSSLDRPVRGDDTTQLAVFSHPAAQLPRSETLASGVPLFGARRQGPEAAPSRPHARQITVDPRRILGDRSELWTFSLDVHRHFGTLISRIWKALRRGGADIPAMSYGKSWALFEPRTGRTLQDAGEGEPPLALDAAGIRSGAVLWIVRIDDPPGR